MRLIHVESPNCLLVSAAMVLDVEPNVLQKEIGHTGFEMIWNNQPAPLCYRSFHIQEIVDCFIRRGLGLMLVELDCYMSPIDGISPINVYEENSWERFYKIIANREAIMIGRHITKSIGHAWAWNGSRCYDPNGFITELDDYRIRETWIKVKMI